VSEVSEAATRRIVRAAASRGTEGSALWVAGAGLVSLALYRALAEIGDLRAHLTVYLVIHSVLFAIYAGIVFLLARRVFTLPPWTARRAAPPFVVSQRDRGIAPGSGASVGHAPSDPSASVAGLATAVSESAAPDSGLPSPGADPGTECAVVSDETASEGPPAIQSPAVITLPEAPAAHRASIQPVPAPVSPDGRPRGRVTPILLVAFAVAFRITLLFVPASLSDDIHRYVWDGRVQASGVNPYRYAPDAEKLQSLRDEEWPKINHRAIPTIYPPLAEAVFGASARGGLGEIGDKAIFVLFDLATACALALLLRRLGRPMSFAALYAWNPLVVVEVAGSGHADPLGVFFLVLAALFIIEEKRVLGIGSYALSILARLLPLAFLPIFIRRFKAHHLLLGAGIVALGYLPYAGARGAMFSGLAAYAEHWDHNAPVFPAVRAALDGMVPVETLKVGVTHLKTMLGDPAWCEPLYRWVYPAPLARGLLALALLVGMILISIDVPEIQRELLCATGLLLVLSPTVHPWYVLWIVPFAATDVSLPWLLFTGLVPFSYLSLRAADGRVPMDVLAMEWGLPAVLGIALLMRKRAVAPRIRALAARA
jgi:alpha-1,6-mannosyltransferase